MSALPGLGDVTRHEVSRLGQGGFVDIMDVVSQTLLDDESAASPVRIDARAELVKQIISVIQSWIGKRPLPARGRMMTAGDILILLRNRQKGGLYHVLDRELRLAGLPVAGADRIKLNEDIAVRDLLALGRTVLLPEDDLTLATVLKSPLFGLDEDDLFRLAYDRGKTRLIQRMSMLAAKDKTIAVAHDKLTNFLELAESHSVHGFYSTVLNSHIRQAFAKRMGNHVGDVLTEFLESARQFEMINPSSLLGFIEDFETSGAEISRESESRARDEIRIMTIHGAKGLESPVVILPDALSADPKSNPVICLGEDDEMPVLQLPGRCISPDLVKAKEDAARKQREEEDRLFYVAMTRAEDGLLVAGFEDSHGRKYEGSQYQVIEAAITKDDPAQRFLKAKRVKDENGLSFLRLETEQVVSPKSETIILEDGDEEEAPPWLHQGVPQEDRPAKPLSPSRLGSEEPARSPVGDDRLKAVERGILAHRMFEILPQLKGESRQKAAGRIIDAGRNQLSVTEAKATLTQVCDLIDDTELEAYFGPDARAEVPILGQVGNIVVSGIIDRLLVADDRITLIDFKTGTAPHSEKTLPQGYINQMALYRHLVGLIWTDRTVVAGLLYTEDASITWIDAADMDAMITEMMQQS
jgi:ATP-dependent helicase/nuclease subunit A